MKKFGYHQSNFDHTLHLKQQNNNITCLLIYVDDIIITGNDFTKIEGLERKLFREFEVKNLRNLKYLELRF